MRSAVGVAILIIGLFVLILTPSVSNADANNLMPDKFVKEMPEDWQHLFPQCQQSLKDYLDGHPTATALKQGYNAASVKLMLEVIKDKSISVHDVMNVYMQRLQEQQPKVFQKLQSALDDWGGELPKVYIGDINEYSFSNSYPENEDLFIECRFKQNGGAPFLEQVNVGRKEKDENGREVTAKLGLVVNMAMDQVPEGHEHLHECDFDRLSTLMIVACDLSLFPRVLMEKPEISGLYFQALNYIPQKDFQKAMEGFDQVLQLHPKNYQALMRRAQLAHITGNNDEAIQSFDKAIAAAGGVFYLYYERSVVKNGLKQLKSALADLNKAIALNLNEAELYRFRGVVNIQQGENKAALADVDEAIRLNPNMDTAHALRGAVLMNLGNASDALTALHKAVELSTVDPFAYKNRAILFAQKGAFPQATDDLNKAIKLNSNFAEAYDLLARIQVHQKQYKDFVGTSTTLLELQPNNIIALNGLAWLRATSNEASYRNGEEALEYAKQAVQVAPEAVEIRDTLAAAYAETGDFAQAIKEMEIAIAGMKAKGGDISEFEKHLTSYKQNKPWRE